MSAPKTKDVRVSPSKVITLQLFNAVLIATLVETRPPVRRRKNFFEVTVETTTVTTKFYNATNPLVDGPIDAIDVKRRTDYLTEFDPDFDSPMSRAFGYFRSDPCTAPIRIGDQFPVKTADDPLAIGRPIGYVDGCDCPKCAPYTRQKTYAAWDKSVAQKLIDAGKKIGPNVPPSAPPMRGRFA